MAAPSREARRLTLVVNGSTRGALAAADVGIAMGGGADVAIESKLPLRLLTAPTVRKIIPGLTRWDEKRGWGWTIMVLAQKPA